MKAGRRGTEVHTAADSSRRTAVIIFQPIWQILTITLRCVILRYCVIPWQLTCVFVNEFSNKLNTHHCSHLKPSDINPNLVHTPLLWHVKPPAKLSGKIYLIIQNMPGDPHKLFGLMDTWLLLTTWFMSHLVCHIMTCPSGSLCHILHVLSYCPLCPRR